MKGLCAIVNIHRAEYSLSWKAEGNSHVEKDIPGKTVESICPVHPQHF